MKEGGNEVPTPHGLIACVCKTSIENLSPLRTSFTKGLMQQSGNPKWTTNNTYPFRERKDYSPAQSSPVHPPKLNVFILLNVVFLFFSSFFLSPFFLCFQFSVCRIHLTPPVIGITKINTLSTPRLFDFVYWLKRSISILLLLFLRLFSFKLYFKFYIEITISWSLQILIASFVINTGMVTHGTDFRIGWIKWISWYI